MPSALMGLNVSLAGLAMQMSAVREAEGQISQQVTLPKAWSGTLTTRTSDTAGVITTTLTHDITAADTITIFWDTGVAYNASVDSVGSNTITFSGASGDVLPAQDYAVTAGKEVIIDTDFDGDLIKMIAAQCDSRAEVQFYDSTPTLLMEKELLAGNCWFWVSDMGWANPLTGNPVDEVLAACDDTNQDRTLKVGVLYDSVT